MQLENRPRGVHSRPGDPRPRAGRRSSRTRSPSPNGARPARWPPPRRWRPPRVLLAKHEERAALYDSRLLARDGLTCRPEDLGVVELDVGHNSDVARRRRSWRRSARQGRPRRRPPRQPCRQTRRKAAAVTSSNQVARMARKRSTSATVPRTRAKASSEISVPVEREPLVDPLEVRARVGADRQPAGLENGRSHPGGRALAVGPGDVDYRVGRLRIAQRARRGP